MENGNYNFFNLLTIIVNLTSYDDRFLLQFVPARYQKKIGFASQEGQSKTVSILTTWLPVLSVVGFVTWDLSHYLGIQKSDLKLLVTKEQLDWVLKGSWAPQVLVFLVLGMIAWKLSVNLLNEFGSRTTLKHVLLSFPGDVTLVVSTCLYIFYLIGTF